MERDAMVVNVTISLLMARDFGVTVSQDLAKPQFLYKGVKDLEHRECKLVLRKT